MIAYLQGTLLEITENACVLLTACGTGYEIFLPTQTLAALPLRGESVSLYISQIVREDVQELFGFSSWDERRTFDILITISKVGARTALAILSAFRPDDLRRIVLDDDALALAQVSGIGKKTAQHIFLELRDKLKPGAIPAESTMAVIGTIYSDALAGLIGLGYAEEEAGQTLKNILHAEPDLDARDALRAALKALGRRHESAKNNSLESDHG